MDIVLMIVLGYFNYKSSKRKGYNGATYATATIGLIMGGELLGVIAGMLFSKESLFTINGLLSIAPIGFAGVLIGAAASFFIVYRLKPKVQNDSKNAEKREVSFGGWQFGNRKPLDPMQGFPPVYSRSQEQCECDVCGEGIEAGEGYEIPADFFYNSQKYKDWLMENPVTRPGVQSLGGADKYLAYMRTRSDSSHAVVCGKCIRYFS